MQHKQISARVTAEFYEQFWALLQELNFTTARELVEFLFFAYKQGKTHTETIDPAVKQENETLKQQLQELQNQLQTLQNQEPQTIEITKEIPASLKENQILVETNYKQHFALEITKSAIFEETGAKLPFDKILLNLFQQYFVRGVGDWLPIKEKHRRNYAAKLQNYKSQAADEPNAHQNSN
jgi:hypothetical protein